MNSQQTNVAANETKAPSRYKVFETVALARVPRKVRVETAESSVGKASYLRYHHSIKGGNVRVHVCHDEPVQFKGRQIVARCELWEQTNEDGTRDMYILLFPVQNTPARHRLSVITGSAPLSYKQGRKFPVPVPKEGHVIFATTG